jgi:hypothetical protein
VSIFIKNIFKEIFKYIIKMQKVETKEIKEIKRPVSETHYLTIDCKPGQLRPDAVLKMILHDNDNADDALMYDDSVSNSDFSLVHTSFGEWKFGVYKDKEQLFELNLPKIIVHLTSLYKCGIIRYAEWSPE